MQCGGSGERENDGGRCWVTPHVLVLSELFFPGHELNMVKPANWDIGSSLQTVFSPSHFSH